MPVDVSGGTQEQRSAVRDAASNVFNTERGQELAGTLNEQNRTVPIVINDDNINSSVNLPLIGQVNVDPSSHPVIETTAGPQAASTERIIAHEVGHFVTGTRDAGPGRMDNVRQNENPIVRELGEPERTRY